MTMTSLHEQKLEVTRPTAWTRLYEMVRPTRQGDVKSNGMQIGNKKHGGGRMNIHEIVAYLKTCGMDPENVELRRSNLGGVHVTFYFDDDTIESTDSSTGSERSQDDHLYNSSKQQQSPPPNIWKLHKSPALVGIENQNNRLLREWA